MSGIPIYSESPINATKASAITQQTSDVLSSSSSTMTTTTTDPQSYPSAKAGASAPAPTQAASQYTPATLPPPTRTTSTALNDAPPPPQPGAFPTATPFAFHTTRPDIPPPPKVGEKPRSPSYYAPMPSSSIPTHASQPPQPYPPQMYLPSPSNPYTQGSQPPASTTSSTTSNPSHAKPATLPFAPLTPTPTVDMNNSRDVSERRSLEHPPGYVQNPYAGGATPQQQFANEQSGNNTLYSGYSSDLSTSKGQAGGSSFASGILGGEGGDQEGVWATMGKWAKGIGSRVGEVEGEVWKRINGES